MEEVEGRKRPRKRSTAFVREPKNSWSENEDALLTSGVETYGAKASSWMRIASLFRGKRDSKQCRERWVEYINPAHSREPFTNEEDDALLNLERQHGRHWRAIQTTWNEIYTPRSATRLKSRWYQLRKRAEAIAPSTQASMPTPSVQSQPLPTADSTIIALPEPISCPSAPLSDPLPSLADPSPHLYWPHLPQAPVLYNNIHSSRWYSYPYHSFYGSVAPPMYHYPSYPYMHPQMPYVSGSVSPQFAASLEYKRNDNTA